MNKNNINNNNTTAAVIILMRMRADLLWEKYEVPWSATIVDTAVRYVFVVAAMAGSAAVNDVRLSMQTYFGPSFVRQLVASMQYMTTAAKCCYSLADCVGMRTTYTHTHIYTLWNTTITTSATTVCRVNICDIPLIPRQRLRGLGVC